MPREPQYPTQCATLFVDLERRETQQAYAPLGVSRARCSVAAARTCTTSSACWTRPQTPLDPDIPLIFGSGSADRAGAQRRAWQLHIVVAGFRRADGLQCRRLLPVVHAHERLRSHRALRPRASRGRCSSFARASSSSAKPAPYVGMDNIDMRDAVQRDLGGVWARNMSMVNITRAGENLVLTSGIMAGPKAIYARGGPGAKMGALQLKAIVTLSPTRELPAAQPYKPYNRHIAQKLLGTSVVKNALSVTGTPFLYKPSRILGAMGTKNNQETTWTDRHSMPITSIRTVPAWKAASAVPSIAGPLNDLQRSRCRSTTARATAPSTSRSASSVRISASTRVETRHSAEQHLQRSRLRHRLDGLGDRVGLRAVPARHHHDRSTPAGSCWRGAMPTLDRAAAVHDRAARRLWQRARRQRARGRTRTLPGRGTEVPHGRQGAVAERSARRTHPQGVRPRSRRRDARDGSPA